MGTIENTVAEPGSAEWLVPGFLVEGVIAALQAEGADIAALSKLVGRDLSPPDAALLWLPASTYLSILNEVSDQLNNPGIGLVVGRRLTESSLHMLGPIIVASTSLRAALTSIDALQSHVLPGEVWRLTQRGDRAYYGPSAQDFQRSARVAMDLLIAFAFTCARRFVGPDHEDSVMAHFAFDPPSYLPLYEQVFQQRVEFNAQRSAVSVPRALLDLHRAGTDPTLADTLCKLAQARFAEARSQESWTARLEKTLRAHDQLAQVDFEKIAATWQISGRTLRRKIEQEGARLSDVLDRVRLERAAQLLRVPQSSLRDIADALGYSEVSSFQRAFKRWAGVGPGEYRQRLNQQIS